MNKLLECTRGPWHGPHISDDSTTCNCTGIVDEGYAGGIARVHVDNGIASITEGGNDCPPLEQAKANGLLLTAAFDHALVWWAYKNANWDFYRDANGGWRAERCIGIDWLLDDDPFGFPTLTDDLRARLIAEMEATAQPMGELVGTQ